MSGLYFGLLIFGPNIRSILGFSILEPNNRYRKRLQKGVLYLDSFFIWTNFVVSRISSSKFWKSGKTGGNLERAPKICRSECGQGITQKKNVKITALNDIPAIF